MSKISQLAINEEGFVFDPASGASFTVNKSGLFILNALKRNIPTNDILSSMAEDFEDTPDELQRDLDDFIGRLKSYRLL